MFSRSFTDEAGLAGAVKEATRALVLDGKPWLLTIKRPRSARSLDQNRLYWAWLHVIAEHNGDDPNYLHEWYKRKYLTEESLVGSAGEIRLESSTARLDTKQMAEYLDKIKRHAGEFFGLHLPCSDDEGYNEMMERYG